MKTLRRKLVVIAATALGWAGAAHAQGIPVYDNASVIQAIQQVRAWATQLQQMQNQLTQMEATYNQLTGLRNLGSLLNNTLLVQYLPQDYVSVLRSLTQGPDRLAGISGSLTDIITAQQLRTCADTETNAAARQRCESDWQNLALKKQVGDLGYRTAAMNIGNLQTYINSIMTSPDPKSLQDLSARIGVEQVRMANEQVKLNTIAAMAKADEDMRRRAAEDAFTQRINTGHAGQLAF